MIQIALEVLLEHHWNPDSSEGRTLSRWATLPAALVLCGLGLLFAPAAKAGSEALPSLDATNLTQLQHLTARGRQASLSFKVEGVVCAVNPSRKLLALREDSGAALLELDLPGALDLPGTSLEPGERVVVEGLGCALTRGSAGLKVSAGVLSKGAGPAEAGSTRLMVRRTGFAPTPAPREVVLGSPAERDDDSPWAAVEGKVVFIRQSRRGLELELTSGNDHLSLIAPDGFHFSTPLLLNSRIRATGICETVRTLGGRLIFGRLTVCGAESITPLEAPPEMWNNYPVTEIASLAGSAVPVSAGRIVHLRGRVRTLSPGPGAVLEDQTGSILVETAGTAPVEAAGPVEMLGEAFPISTNAVLRFGFKRKLMENGLPLLTKVEQVKELNRVEAGRHYPVKIRGVVTASDSRVIRIQDVTQGIFVIGGAPGMFDSRRIGDYVELEGVTDPGTFAPILRARRLNYLGIGRLPEPIHPTWDQLMNGNLDSEYVELQGVVTALRASRFTLLMRTRKLSVDVAGMRASDLRQYENALVRLRGILVPRFDPRSHQVKPGEIRIDQPVFNVDQPAPLDVFDAPAKHPDELLLFDLQAGAFQRVKVSGQIAQGGGTRFYLMDGGKGLRFTTKEDESLRPGDKVEVVGFVELGGVSPALREAVARKVGHSELPDPQSLRPSDMTNPRYDAMRVRVQGRLLNALDDRKEQVLEMQAGSRTFLARLDSESTPPLALRAGSLLELTGVYTGQRGDRSSGRLDSFELLLGAPDDVHVLSRPSWWTVRRSFLLVGTLVCLLGLVLAWNRQLRRLVEERTAQLKEQIRARQMIEHERVMEEERLRVAQDLHDELGSSLTEIGMLGMRAQSSSVSQSKRAAFLDQLCDKARQVVCALDEIVWTMNPKHDSLPSLVEHLCLYGSRFFEAANIEWLVENAVALPDHSVDARMRRELLLAFKEALTNVARHARATEVRLNMQFEGGVLRLILTDNGRGICDGAAGAGGDGLSNMRARLAKVGGRFEVVSRHALGTAVHFHIPFDCGV